MEHRSRLIRQNQMWTVGSARRSKRSGLTANNYCKREKTRQAQHIKQRSLYRLGQWANTRNSNLSLNKIQRRVVARLAHEYKRTGSKSEKRTVASNFSDARLSGLSAISFVRGVCDRGSISKVLFGINFLKTTIGRRD